MCGIVGYVGPRPVVPLLLDGLRRLEYRGYDSAGVALVAAGTLSRERAEGKLDRLVEKLARQPQVILNKCLEMHAHESEGDRIERHGLAALFNGGPDPVDIIKWKDVYTDLEEATDRCADGANVVESIVLQHS